MFSFVLSTLKLNEYDCHVMLS